jgi:hypothetical protein
MRQPGNRRKSFAPHYVRFDPPFPRLVARNFPACPVQFRMRHTDTEPTPTVKEHTMALELSRVIGLTAAAAVTLTLSSLLSAAMEQAHSSAQVQAGADARVVLAAHRTARTAIVEKRTSDGAA